VAGWRVLGAADVSGVCHWDKAVAVTCGSVWRLLAMQGHQAWPHVPANANKRVSCYNQATTPAVQLLPTTIVHRAVLLPCVADKTRACSNLEHISLFPGRGNRKAAWDD
jgi:hypothetical protein